MADEQEPRTSHEEESEDVLTKSDPISQSFIGPLVEFYKDSANLLAKCNKPDRKEFLRVLYATGVGFAVMGAIGFAVKLIHIPINHLLVG